MIRLAAPFVGDEERAAVDRVLRSGQLSQGPEVAAFESEFAEIVDGRHCIAVNSGTSALFVALLAAGIGPGDEVVTPSFTFAATANSIALTGASPVFADIALEDFCLDPSAVEAAITARTVAVVVVDLYGHPARLDELRTVADRHRLQLVEDAAQAHAAALAGTPCGAWGDLAAFSFYPTKNMTTGEGGMIATGDADLARRCRLLRNQGMEQRYRNEVVGLNVRMTDLAAAIGRVQLGRLPDWTEARRTNAAHYGKCLVGIDDLTLPTERDDCRHVYHQYTVRSPDRTAAIDRLRRHGVETGVYYPTPVHRSPIFEPGRDGGRDLQRTDRAADEVFSIPVHPHLTADDLDTVVGALLEGGDV